MLILLFCAKLGFAQNWQLVGSGFSGQVGTLSVDNITNNLYIGGFYKYADTLTCDGIIKWDGNMFSKLTTPISNCTNYCGPATSILNYHNRLFMHGHYGPYNGKIENLFEYVNNTWQVSCSFGIGGVDNIKIINDKLFAFTFVDSLCHKKISSLAVFNGSEWENFQSGITNYMIKDGEYFNGEYYFSGNFNAGSGKNDLMKWTGTNWASLQNGIQGSVNEVTNLQVYKGILYIGGYFLQSDGNISNHLMAWDGQKLFDPFPQLIYLNTVYDIQVIDDELYLSGNFIVPSDNDSSMYVLVRYNGCDLNIFGGKYTYPEYENAPRSIAGFKGKLYAAVGDTFQHKLAKYLVSIPLDEPNIKTIHISDCPVVINDIEFAIYPNPYSNYITIRLSNEFILSETKFIITNSLGQILFTIYPTNTNQLLDLSSLSSSVYFLTVQGNSNTKTVKLIKQ